MQHGTHRAIAIATGVVVALVMPVVGVGTASAVTTAATPATTSATATTPAATRGATATPAPATSAPAPASSAPASSAPASSAPASEAVGAADPSLDAMNAAGDHTMGSTIPRDDTGPAASGLRARQLSANSSAVPGTDGLDVSAWQPNSGINWSQVYGNGARFVYIKATESTTYTSSQFQSQWNGSAAAGVIHGAYHFAVPNASSGTAQANYFLAHGATWRGDSKTLPPLLDIEYNPYGDTCYGLSWAQMRTWISDFSRTVQAKLGVRPAIYTTTDWWTRCTNNSSVYGANPLFIARYPTNLASGAGTLPRSWSRYSMWQYADAGVFPGDQDVYNGTLSNLRAFARSGGTNDRYSTTLRSLAVGKTLGSGATLVSANGQYLLTVKPDGNVVEYGNGTALWSTATGGWTGATLNLATNGRLEIRSSDRRTLIWRAGAVGSGADNLVVTNSGDLALRRGTTVVWHNNRPGADSATPVALFAAGQYLTSRNGLRQAVMRSDGNFVITSAGKVVWQTGTTAYAGSKTVLRGDGNLVVLTPSGSVVKSVGSGSRGVTSMTMQDDGDLVLRAGSTTIWHSGTAGK